MTPPDRIMRTCDTCQKSYYPRYKTQRFCSPKCRERAFYLRKKARLSALLAAGEDGTDG